MALPYGEAPLFKNCYQLKSLDIIHFQSRFSITQLGRLGDYRIKTQILSFGKLRTGSAKDLCFMLPAEVLRPA